MTAGAVGRARVETHRRGVPGGFWWMAAGAEKAVVVALALWWLGYDAWALGTAWVALLFFVNALRIRERRAAAAHPVLGRLFVAAWFVTPALGATWLL